MAQQSLKASLLLDPLNSWGRQYSDLTILIGRILVASVFVLTAWGGNPTAGFLKSLNYSAPDFWSIVAVVVEWIIGLSIILGIATRYGALLGLVYVVVAVVSAHLYWRYPAQQQTLQYVFFTKDIAIFGGLVLLLATGGGRYSLDARWLKE